jgi:hypothetical protein
LLNETEKTTEKIRKNEIAKIIKGVSLALSTTLKRESRRSTTRKSRTTPSQEATTAGPLFVSQGKGLNMRKGA